MDLEIRKLTPALVDDFFEFFEITAFADHPEWGCDCYCCFYHVTSAQEWKDRTAAENRAIARSMILNGTLQGMLAYTDRRPVGWCHYDRKENLPGLQVFSPEVAGPQATDAAAGAIVCFTVAQAYRNQGIAGRLLDAVCTDLTARGFTTAEAYPRPNCNSVEENYHGPLAMFLSRGFTIIREGSKQTLVRKALI